MESGQNANPIRLVGKHGRRIVNDYCNGIAYAIGTFADDGKGKYLVVRNLDKWYAESVAEECGYNAYESKYNADRDGRPQWTVKARNIHALPGLGEINGKADFLRAYIEIHGIIDAYTVKNRKGNPVERLRLRIYGKERILHFINDALPAGEKKIQHIKNVVEGKYYGETCALHYQSKKEIINILEWMDGEQKNSKVWEKWESVIGGRMM